MINTMLKKIGLIAAIAVMGFSTGFSIVYAKIIPGVDRPYDPPDYYSQTSISYADSPSPFFYRDLVRQGGNVLDVTRKIKSALFGADFLNLSNIFKIKTSNDEINTTPFNSSILSQSQQNIDNINATTNAITTSVNISDNALFRSPKDTDPDKVYDSGSQASWLSNTYLAITQSAKNSLEDVENQFSTLNQIIDNNNTATGNLQANEAASQLKALNAALMARRNALLSNNLNMSIAAQKQQTDEELEGSRNTDNTGGYFADPYNQKEYDAAQYEKPAAPGFKDFQ